MKNGITILLLAFCLINGAMASGELKPRVAILTDIAPGNIEAMYAFLEKARAQAAKKAKATKPAAKKAAKPAAKKATKKK